MVKRVKLKEEEAPKAEGLYFAEKPVRDCIPTGCTLLDLVLGGGWAMGRVVNIVGDKAVGKTLLAIEACANFKRKYPKGRIFYREAESAFDPAYAETVGLPPQVVDFGPEGIDTPWDTIEAIFEDLEARLDECIKSKKPGLYILDSLDAVSSKAELERDVGEGSFALEKQKLLGRLFRQLIRKIGSANFCLIIVSQIRDKIGVVFGDKHTRSGGKALDFYASQILWLHNMGIEYATKGGVKRAVGVRIKAKCKKNKVGTPFRECEFAIEFGYGVDDVAASIDWLEEVKGLGDLEAKVLTKYHDNPELMEKLRETVTTRWAEVESRFSPTRKKYG